MGLFETLLVLDGKPVELDAHLQRLATSLRELFGAGLPAGLVRAIVERAAGLSLGRMRIDVDPAGADATLKAQAVDPADFFPTYEQGATLRSVFADGGLGATSGPTAARSANPLGHPYRCCSTATTRCSRPAVPTSSSPSARS